MNEADTFPDAMSCNIAVHELERGAKLRQTTNVSVVFPLNIGSPVGLQLFNRLQCPIQSTIHSASLPLLCTFGACKESLGRR
jgi:hypothetical protein